MNIHDFQKMKQRNHKISMVTCYDYWTARIIADTAIDCILVGDSVAMVVYGHETTLPATVDIIAQHTQAVLKGAPNKFIIADMPFFSYRKDLTTNMNAIETMMQSGAHAIKLERADGNLDLIKHVVQSGVPVMGHLGLTPQSIHHMGGHKIQGRDPAEVEKLKKDAALLEAAGCFALVLECVPAQVAKELTDLINIPTIGIGAGPFTSGQVLVLQDLLGMNNEFNPKFLKKYLNGFDLLKNALNAYDKEVKASAYPTVETHCF